MLRGQFLQLLVLGLIACGDEKSSDTDQTSSTPSTPEALADTGESAGDTGESAGDTGESAGDTGESDTGEFDHDTGDADTGESEDDTGDADTGASEDDTGDSDTGEVDHDTGEFDTGDPGGADLSDSEAIEPEIEESVSHEDADTSILEDDPPVDDTDDVVEDSPLSLDDSEDEDEDDGPATDSTTDEAGGTGSAPESTDESEPDYVAPDTTEDEPDTTEDEPDTGHSDTGLTAEDTEADAVPETDESSIDEAARTGDSCGDGWVYDCGMECTLALFVGDGTCDDASRPFGDWFACPELEWDGGDCEPSEWPPPVTPDPPPAPPESTMEDGSTVGTECGAGMVIDCSLTCNATLWLGDGWCDDESSLYGIHFDCEDFEFDAGDCL